MQKPILVFLLLFFWAIPATAQTSVYSPLSTWRPSLASWEAVRASLDSPVKTASTKPILPGLRPLSVELLQDALLRKHPKLLKNDPGMARKLLLSRYLGKGSVRSRINGRNQLNGAMAEALFLKKNPQWNYVSKPNATQHDVYLLRPGKPPLNGQIKCLTSGRPVEYASEMRTDWRAHRFFVPDDHVDSLRNYWLREYEAAKRDGNTLKAQRAARHAGRVQPLGATSQDIAEQNRAAARFVAAERNAAYVSLAAGIVLSLGQIGWDYSHGTLSADQAAYRTTKALTLIGTGVATNAAIGIIREGALRGSLKGTLLVGAVVLLAETSWNIYEHGGATAFQHPEFYEQLGGSISAVGIGGIAGFYSGLGATALAIETGPLAPFIGAATGFAVGTGVGIVAYIGGRTATGWLLRTVAPQLYQQFERQQIEAARSEINKRLSLAQSFK